MLRPAADRDLKVLQALRSDVETQHLLLAHPKGAVGEAEVRTWVDRRTSEPGAWFRVIADEADRAVGFVQITGIHGIDGYGTLGICVGRDARRRGIGMAAMRDTLTEAVSLLKLRKLLLYVRADNAPALALYETLGFRAVGQLAQHYREMPQQAYDVVLMELLLDGATTS